MRVFWGVISFLFFFLLSSLPAQPAAEITVNYEDVGRVNPYIFGHNTLAYDRCLHRRKIDKFCKNDGRYTNFAAGQWNPLLKRPNAVLVDLAKRIKVSVLRFPGGCGTHHYDWKRAIGPVEKRPMYKFGIDEFMELCRAVGAEPIITLSYFTGTCQDLTDLVEYLNAPLGTNPNGGVAWAEVRAANGHPEPYGVKWFEFGNEVWHGDHVNISRVDPKEYAERYLECKRLIRNVDTHVLLGAVVSEGEWSLNQWSKVVVGILKNNLDFLIVHLYRPWYRSNRDEIPANKLFEITLASPDQIKDILEYIERELEEISGRTVPIAITEYNGGFVQQKPVPYRHSLGNALFITDFLRVFLTVKVPILCANYWQLSNSYWGLVYNPDYLRGGGRYYKRPNYYAFYLYANHFGKILLKTEVQSPGYTQPGFKRVKPTSERPVKISSVRGEYPVTIARISPSDWKVRRSRKPSCVTIFRKNEYLELHFDCDQDINFFHVNFPVELESGHLYRLKGLLKAKNLQASGSGARLSVQDLRGWRRIQWARFTYAVDGTTDWLPVAVDFVPPSGSKGVRVFIRRFGGRDPIRGVVKVKDVVVEDLGLTPQYVPTPYLSVSASTNEKRDRTYLMVINKNLEEPMRSLIKINGFPFGPVVRAWVLNGPSVAATNENCKENVKIYHREVQVSPKDGFFYFTFEPHSLTAIELQKQD
ncbi:alpha-L-arabinofuranosidase C-terminal domain-containing protein [Desulfovulcanus sp.]